MGDLNKYLDKGFTQHQAVQNIKADAIGYAMEKFRYEFEGSRDTDSIESFFDKIELEIRTKQG